MKHKNLIITISGEEKSGKSSLVFLLKKFLHENGFNAGIEVGVDCEIGKHIVDNSDQIVNHIKKTTRLTIKETILS
jgi:pantothenate kinase-related protein Tda10